MSCVVVHVFFFFNDTATTEIYTLSLHDALPILPSRRKRPSTFATSVLKCPVNCTAVSKSGSRSLGGGSPSNVSKTHSRDRKSTRLNSSHANISYAVFCLKKKKSSISYTAYKLQC